MHLNQVFVRAASHLTGEWCRNNQKLILACDMDETLLTESEDDQHFILRPKVLYMLRNLRAFYELCLVTYSTRDRTEDILRLKLDPNGRLFNGRVLCREDVLAGFENKREALFAHLPQGKTSKGLMKVRRLKSGCMARPPAWPYIVMLDDFPAAWSNFSSCIPIRPFLLGTDGGGVTSNGRASTKVLVGECGYMLSVYRFLVKLHAAVFQRVRTPIEVDTNCAPMRIRGERRVVCRKNSCASNGQVQMTAFSALVNLKRRINSAQRFQNMCYVDPGQLLTFECIRAPIERRSRSAFNQSRLFVDLH
ncbi:unnamed protein product [Taenia asiatica]|uniref:FCP1 homology domain-containing protein n=1 Tax=Taenia asiatica TaxID=60517 RepID=A0A0R3VSC7_TAEAS|nr:unnamed protein product [Taenia asiatica]